MKFTQAIVGLIAMATTTLQPVQSAEAPSGYTYMNSSGATSYFVRKTVSQGKIQFISVFASDGDETSTFTMIVDCKTKFIGSAMDQLAANDPAGVGVDWIEFACQGK